LAVEGQSLGEAIWRQPGAKDGRGDRGPSQHRCTLAGQAGLQPQVALAVGTIVGRTTHDLQPRPPQLQGHG
jgi:hypothetical protein